uniref:Uncharacterized protein n=1 Tax=Arundo donax TaxID=35708 RepID=A0A0A9EKY4_ARUDO
MRAGRGSRARWRWCSPGRGWRASRGGTSRSCRRRRRRR